MLTKLRTKIFSINISIFIAVNTFLNPQDLDSPDSDPQTLWSKNLNEGNDSIRTVNDELTIKTNNMTVILKMPRGGKDARPRLDTGGESYRPLEAIFTRSKAKKQHIKPLWIGVFMVKVKNKIIFFRNKNEFLNYVKI